MWIEFEKDAEIETVDMAPTFCNRCRDAVDFEEGCDPWDELAELDALLERLRLKRYDIKHMAPTFCNRCGDAVEEGCDPWDELAELDERLRLKRYDIKKRINQFCSPIVRQLPPDVTSNIFEFCLPDFTDHPLSPFTKEDLSIPLSLGAICIYWREIAWSTPTLWSSLVVLVPTNRYSIATDIAQEWLGRSGQLPLSIRIHAKPGCRPAVPALAKIINQYSTRWSDLDLNIPYHYFACFQATAPILKSIRIRCSDYNPIAKHHPLDSVLRFFKLQLTCPRLERANLFSFPENRINIQWENLTHLTLHYRDMSIYDSFCILSKTPRLVFCKVSCYLLGRRRYPPGTGSPLVLTSLRSLQLINGAEYFLDYLTAPHLEELSLPRYKYSPMKVITPFLRRSACSLRSFTMAFFSISPRRSPPQSPPYFEDFMSLLQSIPSLNTLSIISITTTGLGILETTVPENLLQLVAKVLFSQSSTSLQQQGFLPNLEILEIAGLLYLRPGNYGDLYPLPPVGNAVHGPLQLLKFDFHPTTLLPESMISYLSNLVERGVTVNALSRSQDVLQSSIDYYKRRKDSSCRDWSDNLDSSLFLDF